MNGVITYNTPSIQNGFTFENIKLPMKDTLFDEKISGSFHLITKKEIILFLIYIWKRKITKMIILLESIGIYD